MVLCALPFSEGVIVKMKTSKTLRNVILAVVLILIAVVLGYYSTHRKKTPEEPNLPAPTDSMGNPYNLINGGYSFFPDDVLPDSADSEQYELPAVVCGLPLPTAVKDTPFIIERVAKYSGFYFEDNSGDTVDNCLALVVKNDSKKYVSEAVLVFTVGESTQAVFEISALPAGESCVVLEKERLPLNKDYIFEYYSDNANNYFNTLSKKEREAVDLSEQVEAVQKGGSLTVKSESAAQVKVLYKPYAEGIALGGKVHIAEFNNLTDKETELPLDVGTKEIKIISVEEP